MYGGMTDKHFQIAIDPAQLLSDLRLALDNLFKFGRLLIQPFLHSENSTGEQPDYQTRRMRGETQTLEAGGGCGGWYD